MVSSNKVKIAFKVISALMAGIFLWNQVAWAGDLINTVLEQQYKDQSQTFAPQYLQAQQTAAESLVDQKQAITDYINPIPASAQTDLGATQTDESLPLRGPIAGEQSASGVNLVAGAQSAPVAEDSPIISLTTASGDVIHYRGSAIDYIEKQDGTVLRNIVVDINNNLLGAEISFPDGTVQTIANGKVSQVIRPDGTFLNYDAEELIYSIIYPDGQTASCSYIKDGLGNVIETILTDSEKTSHYDKYNQLAKVEFLTGKKIEYSGGAISKITEADQGQFIFSIKNNADLTITSSLSQYIAPSGTIYRYGLNSGGTPISITVEKNGLVATYNKEGALLSVTKYGQEITPAIISQAQADYDAALAFYQKTKQDVQNCQITLNAAGSDLEVKTAAKDAAQTALNSAILVLSNAQSIKDTKQTAYTDAYNNYLAAKTAYDSANTALNNARALETTTSQALTAAQSTFNTKQTTLNTRIAARQALQATIADLNTKIQANQTRLAQAQQSLTIALAEEETAQTEYNNAQTALNSKQAAYSSAVQDRQAKEAALNTANANLVNVQQAKISAETALSTGSPYIVSSYLSPNGITTLNQYKNFIDDQFDSYNSGVWQKPADTLVTIGNGTATLKGTGKNYNATFYANQLYSRADKPVFTTTFKVSSTSGGFIAALDGYTSSISYRRVGIYVYGGRIYLQTMTGSTASNKATLISSAKANTNYNVEFEVTPESIKVYLWESSAQKPAGPSYVYTTTDWSAVRPCYSLYSGTATVDSVTIRGPNYNSKYDLNGNLVKDVYQDGNTSVYSYSQTAITVSDYKEYLDSPYNLSTTGLWYKPADSLVTINSGIAALKGTGLNYNATFYSNQVFHRADNPIIKSSFQATSTSGKFIAALDGYTSSGAYRRVGIVMQSGRIYVQTMSGSSTGTPKTLVSTAKASTDYNVEFEVTSSGIKIYLWESSALRPTSPSYTYAITDWAAVRPYFSVYSGQATVSNAYINYLSQTRAISAGSSEYSKILDRNQLVKNLNNAILAVNTAQSAYNAANTALNAAKAAETQASQNITTAQAALAAKQTVLNTKIAARQALQATIADLNTKIQANQTSLAQAQQSLTIALAEEETAQTEYNNAQTTLNAKQAAYSSAVQDRQAKETAFNTANTSLTAKTTAKNQADTVLQAAIQVLNSAQTAKDTKQAAYNSAYSAYLSSQSAYNQALTDLNNIQAKEAVAKTESDSLFSALNALLSIHSLFPSQDTILANADKGLNVVSVIYDSEKRIKTVRNIDGTSQNYAEGLPDDISFNNMNELIIDRDGIRRIYDEYGNISSITANGISTKLSNGMVTRVEKEDGTLIEDAVFDANNNMISAVITKSDGVKAIYDGGVVREIDQPDGASLYYDAEGDLVSSVDSKGKAYSYASIEDGGVSYILAEDENGNTIKYNYIKDPSGKIISTIANDGKIVTTYNEGNNITRTEVLPTAEDPISTVSEYEYGRIRRVYKGDELIYRYTYEFDSEGKEIAVIEDVNTGDFKRYKDELLMSVTDKDSLVTSYEYNSEKKISRSTVAYLGKVMSRYEYTYDGDSTIIEDIDGVKRTYYKDNKLIFVEESGKTYAYTYNIGPDGKEETVQELVKVKDGSGNVANYENGELREIVKVDGSVLSNFIFTTDSRVESYTILKDGIKYFIEDGHIARELKSDGTVIDCSIDGLVASVIDPTGKITQYDYEYSDLNQVEYIVATKDGLKYRYDELGAFIDIIDSIGNHYYYDASNRLVKVIDQNAREYYFTYSGSSGSIYSPDSIKQSIECMNSFLKNKIVTDNSNTKIILDRNCDFDFGDGSDGDLRVETGQVAIIDGTKNYKNIYVAPGAVLTVSPWNGSSGGEITIKCTGSVVIEGILETNAKGYRGGCGRIFIRGERGYVAYFYLQGESYQGSQTYSNDNNYGGGGGGMWTSGLTGYGAGGSYGTKGEDAGSYASFPAQPAYAGDVYGDQYLTSFYMGSGGGSGWIIRPATPAFGPVAGGNGGGKIKLVGKNIDISGVISSNGGDGSSLSGGGSGGAIWISGGDINITGNVSSKGGAGYYYDGYLCGGAGGDGRIRVDYGTFIGNMPAPTPYMLQMPYQAQGQLISQPVAVVATEYGYISANVDIPTGADIKFMTRTGVSANINDSTWSDWVESTKDSYGYKVGSPVNKYIQYQAILETNDTTATPSIYSNGEYAIRLNYSYNRVFDATAPPGDLPFKEYLTLIIPDLPITPELDKLKIDSTQFRDLPAEIESRLLPDDIIIQTKSFKDDSGHDVALQISKDNKFTYLIDGKISSVHQKYDDGHVELIMEYTYSETGELANVRLPNIRNSVDTQIAKARQQIAAERTNYLRQLSEQKGLAYTQIRDQVQITRDQINAQRSQLQSQLYQEVTKSKWVGWWIFGWWETYRETVEVPGVRDAINQLNEQERLLNNEESKAYAELNSEVSAAEAKLTQDETAAMAQVSAQEAQFQVQIIKEESTPVILEYYRSILGRDPDEAETNSWLATVSYSASIDANALKTALFNSDERQAQEAFVAGIKNRIKDTLYSYVGLDQEGKGSFLGTLGLSLNDAVALGREDVDAILSFLDKQNIHFGRSAFVSLGTILSDNDVTYDLEDLAFKTILIDIFTGSLNQFSDGKLLELSMYSLSKTASGYGLDLFNAKLDFDDLERSFTETGKAIAHLKNNHFVVVTNITADDKVSYVERNRGKDGYTWTVSKDDFLKGWTGYTIAKGLQDASWLASKVISIETAQRIKGSCLMFLFPLIGAIFGAIAGAATAVIGAISAIVTGISAILGPIISGISTLVAGVANFMVGIGSQIFGAIQFVGSSLLGGLGQFGTWLGGVSSAIFGSTGLGGIITSTGFNLTGLGAALGKTIVTTALSIGISKGLESLGVNSTISGLLSSFVTGGVSGLFNSGFSVLSFVTGGIQGLAIQGVNELAPRLGIDPMLSNVISLTAGAFIGAVGNNISPETGQFNLEGFSASIGKQIMPNVASELAYYGITKSGELLGLDPRISYLAGVGIRSTLQAGLGSNMDPSAIWNGLVNGLLRGGTSIGLQWAYQELDMEPILGSLSAAALTGAIEGLLEGQGAIKGVYDTLFKTGVGLLTLGGSGNNEWARAAYIAQVLDFSNIIQERGVVDALDTYASGFLHQNAIENIWKMGGIADIIANKAEVVVNEEGATVKRVYINPERTDFIDFSLSMDDMVGYKQGNILVDCPIEIGPDGCPTTDNGKVKVLLGGKSRIVYSIKDHNLVLIEYIDANGEMIAFAQPIYGEKSIKMNEDNNSIRTGRFYNIEKQLIVDKRDNQVFRILSTPRSDMTDVEIQELTQNGVEGRYLDGVTIEYDKDSNQVKLEIDPNAQSVGEFEGKTTFLSLISVNGISSEFGKYAAPTYEERLKYRLSSQGLDKNAIYLLPMFMGYGLPTPIRTIKDIGLWLLDNAGTNILTNELIAKLDQEIYGHILPGQQYEPKVMTLFSGSANSFFKAINKRHDYNIRDAIILAGPTLDGMFEETTITSPYLKRVFNICGTKDAFYPVAANKKYSSNVTAYNIEILGASHTDYFYDPSGSSLSARSSYFVENLMKAVYNNENMAYFFEKHQVAYDSNKKIYTVDLHQIDYNPELEWRNGE